MMFGSLVLTFENPDLTCPFIAMGKRHQIRSRSGTWSLKPPALRLQTLRSAPPKKNMLINLMLPDLILILVLILVSVLVLVVLLVVVVRLSRTLLVPTFGATIVHWQNQCLDPPQSRSPQISSALVCLRHLEKNNR